MWRRSSLGIGLALCVCAAVMALAPSTAAMLGWAARLWPVLPILIGVGSLAGFALKRQPRSPWGGAVLLVLGGLALPATLQSGVNPLALYGRYWPILLGVLGVTEVLRYYTRRIDLGERPALFSFGKLALIGIIVSSGFVANRLAEANPNIIANISMPSGLGRLRDNLFGTEFIFDQVTGQAELPANGTVTVTNRFGKVSIEGTDGNTVSVELTPKVRAYDQPSAGRVVASLKLTVEQSGSGVAIGTNRDEIDHQIATDMTIHVPRGAAISLSQAHGDIAISDLAAPTGRLDIESSHSGIDLRNLESAIAIKSDYGDVTIGQSSGSLAIDGRNDVSITSFRGPIRLQDSDSVVLRNIVAKSIDLVSVDAASVRIDGVAGPSDTETVRVSIDGVRTGVDLKNIRGDVLVRTNHERVAAVDVTGSLEVQASHSDVDVARVGSLTVRTDHDDVTAKDVAGAVDIENDHGKVLVTGFAAGCRVKTSFDSARLTALPEQSGDVDVANEHGSIDVRLPAGQNYDIRSDSGRGESDIDPAFTRAATAVGAQRRVNLKTSYGDITVRPVSSRQDRPDPA